MLKNSPLSGAEEKRTDFRRNVYLADQVQLILEIDKTTLLTSCINFSPEGASGAIEASAVDDCATVNSRIFVTVKTPIVQSTRIPGVIVSMGKIRLQDKDFMRIGIKFLDDPFLENIIKAKSGTQYIINEFLQPIVACDDPIFFLNPIFFRLVCLARGGGRLRTSIRNKSVFPGFRLKVTIFFPNLGKTSASIIAMRISKEDSHSYLIDFSFEALTAAQKEAISELVLMSSSSLSIKDLRDEGFFVAKMEKAITVFFPRNQKDLDDLLKLRLFAYHDVGKMKNKSKPEEMYERYDSIARQVLCRVGDKLVGAIRLVFVGTDPSKSEHVALKFPVPDFIIKAGFTELSRACVYPDYRGADLMMSLVRQGILLSNQSKIKYVLANCNPELWPMYKKIGAKKLGKTISAFGRTDCQLIYFEAEKVANGSVSSFFTWNQLVVPVTHYLLRFNTPLQKIKLAPRIAIHWLASHPIKWLLRYQSYRKFLNYNKKKESTRTKKKS